MNSIVSRKAFHKNVCEEDVHLLRKRLSNGDVCHLNYEVQYKALKRHVRWKNEMDRST